MYNFLREYLVYIFPAAAIVLIILFVKMWLGVEKRADNIQKENRDKAGLTFPKPFGLVRVDGIIALIITIVYACTAFYKLGDTTAPQSFYRFTSAKPEIVIDLGRETEITKILYYTGNWHNDDGYNISYSMDGKSWGEKSVLQQTHATTYHWLENIPEEAVTARYVKIRALSFPMELGELTFHGAEGYISPEKFDYPSGTEALFDEQDIRPEAPSYMNSMYFDEIYHGRTAYEFLEEMRPYETTHPPLGKVFISIGVSLFGMTPFGWRFVGTLFGVLMVPIMYVFIKKLFGRTAVATMGTLLFSFDFMHITQTRIATIDTYGVFFTILMYFFMYLYISSDFNGPKYRQLIPLALCGISFGLGIASKWTCFYAAIGLVVLYVIYLVWQGRIAFRKSGAEDETERRAEEQKRRSAYFRRLMLILVVSVIFFVIIAFSIYYFSYWLYAKGMGEPLSPKLVWENQVGMLDYHSNVTATHPYQSDWWMWLVDARPILYYRTGSDYVTSFAAWLNPIVCWTGLLAIIIMIVKTCGRKLNNIALFIIIGYLAQLVPWIPISRCTFAYHYFPSMIFLVLAMSYVFDRILAFAPEKGKYTVALTAGSVGMFVMFFPVLVGVTVPRWYYDFFLGWFPSWPF